MSFFTLDRRNEVQEKLLEAGVELIKEKGIQKMAISEATSRAGIGKGTFYHFYSAKEYYVYDVYKRVFGLHVIMDFGANKTLTGGL